MVAGRGVAEGALAGVLARAEGGDREAFGELYRCFSRRVLGLCLHLLGSREDAEDATSEVFLRVRAALARYDRTLPFAAWLTSIATNHCLDRLRRRRRDGRLFDPQAEQTAISADEPSPLAELMAQEERVVVMAAVAALPEQYRVPLTLRYYAEMSYEEIAGRLGLTRQQVATSLFRARRRLRRALARGGSAA